MASRSGGIVIRLDTKRVDEFLDAAPRKTGLAILRATKRGTKAANTLAARVVAKDMGLKVGDVKSRIRIINPTAQTMTGELRASLKRIPTIKFGAKQTRRGVTARGKAGRTKIPGAFIATMPSSHTGVFERKGKARLPIRQLYGPSVGHVFLAHESAIVARGEEQLLAELNHQLDRIVEAA